MEKREISELTAIFWELLVLFDEHSKQREKHRRDLISFLLCPRHSAPSAFSPLSQIYSKDDIRFIVSHRLVYMRDRSERSSSVPFDQGIEIRVRVVGRNQSSRTVHGGIVCFAQTRYGSLILEQNWPNPLSDNGFNQKPKILPVFTARSRSVSHFCNAFNMSSILSSRPSLCLSNRLTAVL